MVRKNNKGITLVELIISIGIFAVVMVALFNVLVIATKNYSKNNTEIKLQNEAQSLMNKLDNLIAPARYGASSEIDENGNTYIYIVNEGSYIVVWNNLTNNNVYMYEGTSTEYTTVPTAVTTSEGIYQYKLGKALLGFNNLIMVEDFEASKVEYLLAENIDIFTVSVNNSYGYVSVILRVKDQYSTANFTASKNINMRNITKNPTEKSTTSATTAETTTDGETTTGDTVIPEGGNVGGETTVNGTTQAETTETTTKQAPISDPTNYTHVVYTLTYNVTSGQGRWQWKVSDWEIKELGEDGARNNKTSTVTITKYAYENAPNVVKTIPNDLNTLFSIAWGPTIQIVDLQIEFINQ